MCSIIGAMLILVINVLPCNTNDGFGCPTSLLMKDSDREKYLSYHNELRRNIAFGNATYSQDLKPIGPASNMYELEWDCKLEEIAQQAVDTCTVTTTDFAQNSASFKGTWVVSEEARTSINIQNSLTEWVRPLWLYRKSLSNVFNDDELSAFANMVYSKSTKIGCSFKWCGDLFAAACLYNKFGNRPDTVLWEKGQACKSNEDCATYTDSQCSGGLCMDTRNEGSSYESVDGAPITIPPKPEEKPSDGEIIGNCPTDTEMTEEIRKEVVNRHNKYRTLVAKGMAENKFGGYAPKAARMRKMVYDCSIEENAMKHAKRCNYGHSDGSQIPGLGENLWAIWTWNTYSLLNLTIDGIDCWFDELKRYGMPNDLILNDHALANLGHYTQMVYQITYHVGCAITHCPSDEPMYYLVCQYAPAGNYYMGLIYDEGEPCKTDADCNCNGCKCSQEEALCIMPPTAPWSPDRWVPITP